MKDLRKRLKEISEKEWEEGFQTISEMAILQAKDIIKMLELQSLTDKTYLYPTCEGGILFEWNEPGIRLNLDEEVTIEDMIQLEVFIDGTIDPMTTEDLK